VCDRCDSIERELVAFQRLRATIEDQFTLVLIAEAVKDLQSERAALHVVDADNGGEQGRP
jgi:hypothetical protein